MKGDRATRVLIVDDSATARAALRAALRRDPKLEVVGEAEHGESALALVERLRPDVVTMDMYLQGHNGLDITRQIMRVAPTPIVMVTAVNPTDPTLVYEALRVGVLDVLGKLPGPLDADYEIKRAELTRVLKTLSRVPVVRRTQALRIKPSDRRSARPTPVDFRGALSPRHQPAGREAGLDPSWSPRVVLIGASTGGPPLLSELFKSLSEDFPIPIVVVQHLAAGFTDGFAQWLGAQAGRNAVVVRERTYLEDGSIYVAGEGCHLQLATPTHVAAVNGPEVSFHRPSVDVLFQSAARCLGNDALAILCTGLGADGAHGMRVLFDAGARTIVQKPSSCAVDSMPRRALALGGVGQTLEPKEIASELKRLGSIALQKRFVSARH